MTGFKGQVMMGDVGTLVDYTDNLAKIFQQAERCQCQESSKGMGFLNWISVNFTDLDTIKKREKKKERKNKTKLKKQMYHGTKMSSISKA